MIGRRRGRPPFDAVVKVGGSLQRWRGLPALVRRLASIGREVRILVVPGGGRFADLVRAEQRRLGLEEPIVHGMALRAMDQYGLLIASLAPRAVAIDTLAGAARVAAAGRLPVLLATRILEQERSLERSFRLTSDSIAAFLAGRLRSPRLILLKSVAGPGRPLRDRSEARRLADRGVVDLLFHLFLPSVAATWILGVRRPDQSADLIAALKARTRPASRHPLRPPVQRAPRAPM